MTPIRWYDGPDLDEDTDCAYNITCTYAHTSCRDCPIPAAHDAAALAIDEDDEEQLP